jgi:hypothetical protein
MAGCGAVTSWWPRPTYGRCDFEEFVRHRDGRARFANELRSTRPIFCVFHPVRQVRRKLRKSDAWHRSHGPWHHVRSERGLERMCDLAAARRWMPCNPLFVHLMRVEDARMGRL